MSAIDVTVSTIIAAPRNAVARHAMDHPNDPAWIGGISKSELQGQPPISAGSWGRRVASFLEKEAAP